LSLCKALRAVELNKGIVNAGTCFAPEFYY